MKAQAKKHSSLGNGKNGAAVGLVLLGSGFRPVYMNSEAVRVLAYPRRRLQADRERGRIARRLRSALAGKLAAGNAVSVEDFVSGRRRYLCRLYALQTPAPRRGSPAAVVVLERPPRLPSPGTALLAPYHFTAREDQVVRLVLNGLSNKEIAERMGISPYTVKAFLRLIMMKMGVSSRFGILERIFHPLEPLHASA
jgi:DNA-binding CsgD family transcriptional regulator